MAGEEKRIPRRSLVWIRIEDVLTILCVISLWPTVFRIKGTGYTIMQVAALAVLVVILVFRVRRLHVARSRTRDKTLF